MPVDLFNMGSSNNAPPPIPGGYGNPTGANTGMFSVAPRSNNSAPAFPANGGSPTNPMAGLSSGFAGIGGVAAPGTKDDNLGHELVHAYGEGTGNAILQLLYKGMFNPQVAQSLLASMQPGIQRGQADILNAFGAGGNRFSSSAALGLGDFNSQVQLNQGQILSNLFLQDQSQQMQLLQSVLPTLHAENANKKGIMGDILGGLEIAGGLAAAPFTGGASLSLVGSGVGSLLGGGGGGGGGASSGGGNDALTKALMQIPGLSGNSSTTPPFMPSSDNNDFLSSFSLDSLTGSGGSAFFGGDSSNSDSIQLPWY